MIETDLMVLSCELRETTPHHTTASPVNAASKKQVQATATTMIYGQVFEWFKSSMGQGNCKVIQWDGPDDSFPVSMKRMTTYFSLRAGVGYKCFLSTDSLCSLRLCRH